MEEHNTVDVGGIAKEGPKSLGFDLENALATGPVEDCSDGNSIPCKKVQMSGDNTSLYVEISSTKCETMFETDDEVWNNEEAGDLEIMEETSTNGCRFTKGDVVWVMTKNKLWWPGKIRNPSEFAKQRVKASRPQGCLLVSYMANGHVSWYRPSQLKPFHEDVAHMSRQDKSKTFIVAVEKSMEEFGLHLKSRLVSLASPQAQGLACGIGTKYTEFSMAGALGEVSATLLNSRDLISHIKNLALAVFKPRVLEPAILGGYVSAFYCSLMSKPEVVPAGWETEPSEKSNNKWDHKFESDKGIEDIDTSEVVGDGPQTERKSQRTKTEKKFVGRNDGDTNVESFDGHKTGGKRSSFGSSGKGSELRPRKKSKYLSYPYINLGGKQVPARADDDVPGSGPVAKLSSTFQQKMLNKLGKISVEELSRISSIELLLELRIAASGCLYPVESEHLERVEVFFYRFRSSSFDGDSCTQEMSKKSLSVEKGKQNEEACEDEAKNPEELRRTNLKFPAIILTEAYERKESTEKSNLKFPRTAIEDVSGKKDKLGKNLYASIFAEIDKNGRNLEDSKPPQILLEAMNVGIVTPLQIPAKESSGLANLTSVGSSSAQLEFSEGSGVPVHVGFTEGDHARNKIARMDKDVIEPGNVVETCGSLSDSNGTPHCANSSDKDSQGPNPSPAQTDLRKRKIKGRGIPIILTFSEGNPIPPKDVLDAEFSKFGPLQGVIAPSPGKPNVARVTFFRKKDANKAHQSLETSNPFGAALVKFELQLSFPSKALENLTMRAASFISGASSINPLPNFLGHTAPTVDGPTSSLNPALSLTPGLAPVLYPATTLIPVLTPAPTFTSVPPLDHMKQNLEMMISMLKEYGHELFPETRAKLELEIKRLLRKVNFRIHLSSS